MNSKSFWLGACLFVLTACAGHPPVSDSGDTTLSVATLQNQIKSIAPPIDIYVLINRSSEQSDIASISLSATMQVDPSRQELLDFRKHGNHWWVTPAYDPLFQAGSDGDYTCLSGQKRATYNPCDSELTRSKTTTKIAAAIANTARAMSTLGTDTTTHSFVYGVSIDPERVQTLVTQLNIIPLLSPRYDQAAREYAIQQQQREQAEALAQKKWAAEQKVQSEAQARADADSPRDSEGRKILRGPLSGGIYNGVHVISDSVGIEGFSVSIVNSVIDAPVCIETSGNGSRIMNNVLNCPLGVRFTSSQLMNNQLISNRCAGQCTNRPDVFGQ